MPKIKEFSTRYGISFQKNDVWYKVESSQTIEYDENKIKQEDKDACWDQCVEEVDKQVEEILKLHGD